jgi:amidophosphoribosyltransferase
MFAMRDPRGIRPAFYYIDDEVAVLASERPVLQTTFDLEYDDVKELQPGTALIVRSGGEAVIQTIMEPEDNLACSFERIYFSRGSDRDIYQERKKLGHQLTPKVLEAVGHDIGHTVFSFIPTRPRWPSTDCSTASSTTRTSKDPADRGPRTHPHPPRARRHSHAYVRSEKVAWKDIKLRTFITEATHATTSPAHVYDITYGSIERYVDNLVIIDDSTCAAPRSRRASSISSTACTQEDRHRELGATDTYPTIMASTCRAWRSFASSAPPSTAQGAQDVRRDTEGVQRLQGRAA